MMHWIKAEDKKPEFPCVILWGDNPPRTPCCGIITVSNEDGETLYFDGDLLQWPAILDGARADFLVKENAIKYWMPLPEPPEGCTKYDRIGISEQVDGVSE